MDNEKKPSLNITGMILVFFMAIVAVFTLVMGFRAPSRNHEKQGDVKAGFEHTQLKHGVTKEY